MRWHGFVALYGGTCGTVNGTVPQTIVFDTNPPTDGVAQGVEFVSEEEYERSVRAMGPAWRCRGLLRHHSVKRLGFITLYP
jgi:hypothetical protein